MEIRKEPGSVSRHSVSREDMILINRLSKRELTPDQVYTFAIRLCDNEIDREWERFPRETLEALAPLFVGKSGIFDHDWSASGQAARIYKTQVVDEPGGTTRAGDPACYLKGWAYMLRTGQNADLIAQIEGGIKKEVSVGCAVEKEVCSVCGEALGSCRHVKGRTYNGKLCWGELKGARDAYEWSFVAVPAQREAGVVKGLAPSRRLKELALEHGAGAELEALESEAALGRRYMEELRGEVVRLMGLAEQDMDRGLLRTLAGRLELEELLAVRKVYRRRAERMELNGPQLGGRPQPGAGEDGGAFLV